MHLSGNWLSFFSVFFKHHWTHHQESQLNYWIALFPIYCTLEVLEIFTLEEGDEDGNESGKSEIFPWMKLAFFLSMSKTIILRFNFVEISRILSSLVRIFGAEEHQEYHLNSKRKKEMRTRGTLKILIFFSFFFSFC